METMSTEYTGPNNLSLDYSIISPLEQNIIFPGLSYNSSSQHSQAGFLTRKIVQMDRAAYSRGTWESDSHKMYRVSQKKERLANVTVFDLLHIR